ncbi:MAG: 50S ribosomal protein L24 [Deltaproteobacteria bacterium]|nr:MAG: 50S ribosomal protein L24 [Deltaproteobacteria bacterium]
MKIKKNDLVKVIAGKDRLLPPARVLRVFPDREKVIVEGRNLVKKHIKGNPSQQTESQILETEAPIHVSNVMLFSEKIGKPVRTTKRWVGKDGALFENEASARDSFDGSVPKRVRKVRFAPKSEEVFE